MSVLLLAIFVKNPSFPTPDKIIVFLVFIFMAFGQAIEGVKRFGVFVLIILAYESFRGSPDQLNSHVDFTLAPAADKLLFGDLPTVYFQNWLWRGSTQWYDVALYLPYMLHFILPMALGLVVWKRYEKYFWTVITGLCIGAFLAFFTFLIFPAAPPWMASDRHYIQPVERISSHVWASLGIEDFPTVYHKISPNPVAAVPSHHVLWATLFSIYMFKIFGKKWGLLSLAYPLVITFGTIYEGEHYAFDAIVGVAYAYGSYRLAPYVLRFIITSYKKINKFIGSKIDLAKT